MSTRRSGQACSILFAIWNAAIFRTSCRSVSTISFINNLRFSIINYFFSSLLQFHNTRSKDKGEKEKAPGQDSASDVDVDEANLSLMDRTRRQAKAAKGLAKQAVDPSTADDNVPDLEEVVFQTRERVKAARAAKARADALRQELLQLQEEEVSIAADHGSAVPAPVVPAATDPGVMVAASLDSAVNILIFYSFNRYICY